MKLTLYDKEIENDEEYLKEIYRSLEENIGKEEVELDFSKVEILTTEFCNDTIGKLFLRHRDLNDIFKNLKISNIKDDDSEILTISVRHALRIRKTRTNEEEC